MTLSLFSLNPILFPLNFTAPPNYHYFHYISLFQPNNQVFSTFFFVFAKHLYSCCTPHTSTTTSPYSLPTFPPLPQNPPPLPPHLIDILLCGSGRHVRLSGREGPHLGPGGLAGPGVRPAAAGAGGGRGAGLAGHQVQRPRTGGRYGVFCWGEGGEGVDYILDIIHDI